MDEDWIQSELHRISAALENLDRRVGMLEQLDSEAEGRNLPTGRAVPKPSGVPAYSLYFARLATVCFVLVGALVLRIATQKGFLPPLPGIGIGLAYCAILLAAPYLPWSTGFFRQHGPMLQYCGLALIPLIVLEATQNGVFSVAPASLTLLAAGLAGAWLGVRGNSWRLSAFGLVCQTVAIAGLGLTLEAAGPRGASLVVFAALAIGIAHFKSWQALRPFVILPVVLILSSALALTARRPEVPPGVPSLILLCVIGVGLLVVVSSALRWRILTRAESAWLPFIGAWVYGLAYFYAPSPTVQVGAGVSIVSMALAGWLARRSTFRTPSLTGLSVAGAVLAALSFSSLDPTGIGWAAAALVVLFVSREIISSFLGIFSHLMVIGSVIVAFWQGRLLALEHADWASRLLGGIGLVLLLLGHHYLAGGSKKSRGKVEANRLLAPLTLLWTVVVFYCVLRLAAFHVFAEGSTFQLSQTVILTGLAIVALSVGKWMHKQVWYYLGLFGIAVLTFKVVLFDLFSLEGSYLLGSVCSLGAASVMTSLALRRREPRPDDKR